MIEKKGERHRYGQHYTPPDVARLMAAFCVKSADAVVLDPSCGDGRLLRAASEVKQALSTGSGGARLTGPAAMGGLFGIDRSHDAVALATSTGAQVSVADFFDLAPGACVSPTLTLPGHIDAIIGNPPYIRQELMGGDKARIQQAFSAKGTQETVSTSLSNSSPRMSRSRTRHATARHAGQECSQELILPEWSGRSDIYVYFFAHAARFLRPGGKLVFLTSSSWLDVEYGAQLREFMFNNFRVLAIVESAAESFFDGASINTSISILQRESDAAVRNSNIARFIRLAEPLARLLKTTEIASQARTGRDEIGRAIKLANLLEGAAASCESFKIREIAQQDLAPRYRSEWPGQDNPMPKRRQESSPNWGRFLRADDVFFKILERGSERLRPLTEVASVRFGVKTGANEFFYFRTNQSGASPSAGSLSPASPDVGSASEGMTELEQLAGVRRGLTTGANEFFYIRNPKRARAPETERPARRRQDRAEVLPAEAPRDLAALASGIEPQYLRPVVFSLKEIPGLVIEDAAPFRKFFDCREPVENLAGAGALDYIRAGERARFHLRRTCAARHPWYAVTRNRRPAPLVFPSKVGERFLVAMNRAGVYEDKKLYGIFPKAGLPQTALAALLNSTWARYYVEMSCRQLTGAQAIADIDVSVASRLLIPNPELLHNDLLQGLADALEELSRRPIVSIFSELERPDRRALDELVLQAIGFRSIAERRLVLDELYNSAASVVRARTSREMAVSD